MRRSPGTTHAYWLVGIVAATTVVVLLGFHQLARERDAMRFRNATEAVQDSIRARLDAHVAILLAARGQVASDQDGIDVHSFRTFVGYLDLPARYPGILGVGFTRRLRPDELDAAVAETIAHGQVPFRVWPAEPRDEYHAIVFLEPLDRRNQAALGYDMFTDPVRREAMARARDTGEPAASGKVTLVQEIDDQKQAGFLIYVPVYEGGARPSTLDERREKLVGFVYSPFRMEDLLRGVFGTQAYPRIAFDIYDGPQVQPEALMHRGVVRAPDAPRARSVVQMDVAGRSWSIDMRSTAAFAASSTIPVFPWLVGLAVLLNVAFCVAMYAQVRARRREEAARQRLAVLADSSQRFSEAQLDLPLVLRTITREIAHRLGDSCTINLVDETGAFLELAEACHVDPAAEASLRELLARERIPVGETSVGKVAATGTPLLVPVVAMEAMLASTRPEYRDHLRRFPVGSLVTVPLRSPERVIGTLTASRRPGDHAFTVDDQQLLADISDRAAFAIENARLADRLRDAMRDAQQAVRIRDEFLAIAGHELRTPITALQLQIDGIVRQAEKGALGSLPPRVVERLRKAQGHVERLEVLIAGLLDVSRIAAGKLAVHREEVELAALISDVIDRFTEPLGRAGCVVAMHAPAPVVGEWDRLRLDQVFSNLLGNAIKYGAGKPIDISIGCDDGTARVAVRDQGIGVPPEDASRIFGRFERAVSDRNYGGLGLGLWISREIVHAFGGTIHIKSELGAGSTFTVELPLQGDGDA